MSAKNKKMLSLTRLTLNNLIKVSGGPVIPSGPVIVSKCDSNYGCAATMAMGGCKS